MQLGTRWSVGDEAPARLPEVVLLAVQRVEDDLAAVDVDTDDWRWTMTWLEGRPVLELDDGTTITYDAEDDEATITLPDSDDDFYDDRYDTDGDDADDADDIDDDDRSIDRNVFDSEFDENGYDPDR